MTLGNHDNASAIKPYLRLQGFEPWVAATVDAARLEPVLKRLDLATSSFPARMDWAQGAILRASAFETGAVENMYPSQPGATISVAFESPDWRENLRGERFDATNHFEDQITSYEHARKYALNKDRHPLSEALLRSFHSVVTESQTHYAVQTQVGGQQHAMSHGQYKTTENQVIDRAGVLKHYCPASEVGAEMNNLVNSTRNASFAEAHPIVQSAYLHWALVHIHPFADGNGRAARVISSIPLLETYGVPLLVFADRKGGYIQALEGADAGLPQDLVDYFLGRTIDTLLWLVELLESGPANDVLEDVQQIEVLLRMPVKPVETPKDAATRLSSVLCDMIRAELELVLDGSSVALTVAQGYYYHPGAGAWRGDSAHATLVNLSVTTPAEVAQESRAFVGYSGDIRAHHALRIFSHDLKGISLTLEDCSPSLSAGADARLRNFVKSFVAKAIKSLQLEIMSVLKMHGSLPTES